MLYLISQVLLLLALASVISGLLGWLLRAFHSDKHESALKRRLHRSQRSVPSMQRALAAAHYEIDRRENDIHRLRRKIAEIDSDPGNFRPGDFDDLNGMHPDERAYNLVRDRAVSGNSQFRQSDFENGLPTTEAHERQAVEFLNTRIEDTDGKYRAEDFSEGYPVTQSEHREADQINAQRQEVDTFYRDGDFEHGVPRNAEEQHYADHIEHLREERKAERQADREHRRVLVLELDTASDALRQAKREAEEVRYQLDHKSIDNISQENRIGDLEQALANAQDVVRDWEYQIDDLQDQIKQIDNRPEIFREGDLDQPGRSADEIAEELHIARATSGNSQFRSSDFAAGIPVTEQQKQQAVEYLNTRDEDTDGKYRENDFAAGHPVTDTDHEKADHIDEMRSEPEIHYRDGDFEQGAPVSGEEQRYADHIVQLREENKAERQEAKEQRRELVLELDQAKDALHKAQLEADDIKHQHNQRNFTSENKITNLENALSNAHEVIKNWEVTVDDLNNQIKSIDNHPQNFRPGDLEKPGQSAEEIANELHIARATSGNSNFRETDFSDGIPVTDQDKQQAVEYLNTRDEDTDGKYRDTDFAAGHPVTDTDKKKAESIDEMRTENETHYRDGDFVHGAPTTAEEQKHAAQIALLREENKDDRQAAREHRRILMEELSKANDSLESARKDALDLTQQLAQNDSSKNEKIFGLETALTSAQDVIAEQEQQIEALNNQIKEIDNDPQNFRLGDLNNLDANSIEDKVAELYLARVESGNTDFRGTDFENGVPQTEAEKLRAVEFMNTRDEDTDGKYREGDFASGLPLTEADKELSDKIDAMRSEMEKHYRESDFEGDKPNSERELQLAAQIDVLRVKNKSKRKLAKQQRRKLVEELKASKATLAEAKDELEIARTETQNLNLRLVQGESDKNQKITSLEKDFANAQAVIKEQEQQIVVLNTEIKEIDNDPQNFRLGDLNNLDAGAIEEKVAELYLARVDSGNTAFRNTDFENGVPQTEADKLRAVEMMNTRDEDTDGKYREGDFVNGEPQTAAEKELSAKIDEMRSEIEKHYRESDFEGEKPSSEKEMQLAAQIDVLRVKNKSKRKLAKQRRRNLVKELNASKEKLTTAQIELDKANASLAMNRQETEHLNRRLEQGENKKNEAVTNLEKELASAQAVIKEQEQQIEELNVEIKEIDNDPQNFRLGDLKNLDPGAIEEKVAELYLARVDSGNTAFRSTDFDNGVPQTEAEKLRAVEMMNTRDEDTDGKYREGDFANGEPQTAAEKELSARIDEMRSEIEKHYRESDFEGDKPNSEKEMQLASQIDVLRVKNKSKRKLAKQRRRNLVKQLKSSKGKLAVAQAEIDRLQQQINAGPSPETVSNLETALTEANGVIERRETRINELETQIQEIDTDPNHFRNGDMDNLDGQSAIERAMEIAVARATSGNSQFRGQDFQGRVPLTDEEKQRAIEFLAERDEDTDGKYRLADFANGVPSTAAEEQQAAVFDSMRTEPEKHYREDDFEGDKPQSESELKLAARIDVMRVKNKAYRSAAKKQRKILKQDLINVREEHRVAVEAVAELKSRMQGVSTSNEKLEDIIASLRENISSKTALEKQAGKKADELALNIDKLERDLAKATHEGHRKAGDLERELGRVKDDLNAAQQECKLQNQAVQSARDTLTERSAEKEKLQEQLAQQKTELALANSDVDAKKQEIVKLTAEKDREIQELQFSLKTQQETNARLEDDLRKLKGELQTALNNDDDRAEREALEVQKAATEARVNELEAALQEQTITKNQSWEELKEELASLNVSLERKDTDLRDANNQLESLQDNLSEYEETDSELRNRVQVLETLLAEQRRLTGKSMTSRIREIESMLAAERRKVESMTIESSISDIKAHGVTPKAVTSKKFSRKTDQ